MMYAEGEKATSIIQKLNIELQFSKAFVAVLHNYFVLSMYIICKRVNNLYQPNHYELFVPLTTLHL